MKEEAGENATDKMKGVMVLKAQAHVFVPMCLLMTAGFGLLVVGFVFIFINTGQSLRTTEIRYNAAVQEWNQRNRNDFSVGFTVSTPDFSFSAAMVADESPDTITAGPGITLTEYTPLKYVMPIGQAIPPVAYSTGRNVKIQILSSTPGSVPFISQELLVMPTLILNSTTLNCSFATCLIVCRERFGNWDPVLQQCAIFMALDDFCSKVIGSGSSWSQSDLYGGNGCWIQSNWTPANYTIVPTIPKPYYMFSGNLSLRSVYDPYIVAASLTNGSFHITKEPEPELLRLGEGLGVVGIALLIGMLVAMFAAFQYFHRKYFGTQYRPVQNSRFH